MKVCLSLSYHILNSQDCERPLEFKPPLVNFDDVSLRAQLHRLYYTTASTLMYNCTTANAMDFNNITHSTNLTTQLCKCHRIMNGFSG